MLRRAGVMVVVLGCALGACEKRYATTFTCTEIGDAACPEGHPCPTVPLGSGGCEDLPGLFGHAPTPVDAGRPLGCEVGLSYGNPYYGDTQQGCICTNDPVDASSTQLYWACWI